MTDKIEDLRLMEAQHEGNYALRRWRETGNHAVILIRQDRAWTRTLWMGTRQEVGDAMFEFLLRLPIELLVEIGEHQRIMGSFPVYAHHGEKPTI